MYYGFRTTGGTACGEGEFILLTHAKFYHSNHIQQPGLTGVNFNELTWGKVYPIQKEFSFMMNTHFGYSFCFMWAR